MVGHDLFMPAKLAPNWHLSQVYSIMWRTVNPLAYAFSGSNPLLPIFFAQRKVMTFVWMRTCSTTRREALGEGEAKM
jgi:hypothetical protein